MVVLACKQAMQVVPEHAELRLQDLLVSKISRKSIELLKKHFMDDMTRDDWRLVVKLKKTFQID